MRLVIVGDGLVGTALAARLGGDDGLEVVLCAHSRARAETAGSTGMFAWGSPSPTRFEGRLRERAWSIYEEFVDADDVDVDRVGGLHLAETDEYATHLQEAASALREYGVEASYVAGTELEALGVSATDLTGGLYTPDDCAFDASDLLEAFLSRARERGVDVRTGPEVTDIATARGEVTGVETDRGDLEADAVVNAAGPGAIEVNRMAGVSLPLSHVFSPVVVLEGALTGPLPFTVLESRRYLRPVGKVRAYFGEWLTEYTDGRRYDPVDLEVPGRVRAAASAVGEVVPGLERPAIVDEWVGLRTATPDGLPIVGETPIEGFYVACRSTDFGVTLAPVVADVLAKTLEGTVERDVAVRLSPRRF